MKNKNTAGLLCFFLGELGIHRFYLGQTGLGVLCLFLSTLFTILSFVGVGLFCWIVFGIVLLVEAIMFWAMDDYTFNQKYNSGPQYNPGFYQPNQYPGGYPQQQGYYQQHQGYYQQPNQQGYYQQPRQQYQSPPSSQHSMQSSANSDIKTQKLIEIKNLRSAGVISNEEYEKRKMKILSRY